MKRKFILYLVLVFCLILTLATFLSCSTDVDSSSSSKHTIRFYVDSGSGYELYGAAFRSKGNELIRFPKDPTRDGYVFDGWYLDKLFSTSSEVKPNSYLTKEITEDIDVYAKFVLKSSVNDVYAVVFETNGGSEVAMQAYSYGATLDKTKITTTRDGYEFLGWYLDKDLTIEWDVDYGRIRKNIVLYAKWNINGFSINYELDGGTNNSLNKDAIEQDEVLTLYAPSKVGYEFSGWYLDSEFKEEYLGGEKLTKDLTLYAKFDIKTYNVLFSVPDDVSFDDGGISSVKVADTITINTPTKTGYTFVGWYFDSTYKTKYTDLSSLCSFADTNKLDTVTLYAKIEETKFNVNYHIDSNVNNSNNPEYYLYFSGLTLENPSKEGYTFNGWFLNQDLTEAYDASTNYLRDLDLYPSWSIVSYNITYHLSSGESLTETGIDTFNVEKDLSTYLPRATKSGYVFVAWYLDSALSERLVYNKKYTTSLDLYPKFTESDLIDSTKYTEVVNAPSLYFTKGDTKNLCVTLSEDNVVSSSNLTSDNFVNYIDSEKSILVVKADYFNDFEIGEKVRLKFTLSSGDILNYYVTVVETTSYTLTLSQYLKGATSYTIQTSATSSSSIKGVSIDNINVKTTISDGQITISGEILDKLSLGKHYIEVQTDKGISNGYFNISDNSKYNPYNVKIDVDSTFPNVYVTWDYDFTPDYFEVSIDSNTYTSISDSDLFNGNSFNATGKLKIAGQKVVVSAYYDNILHSASSVTFKLNLYSSLSSTTYAEGVEDMFDTYTVYGKTCNFYITSWEELYDFLMYTYLYKDSLPTETLSDKTYIKLSYCIDFDTANCDQIDLSSTYYSKDSSYDPTTMNNDLTNGNFIIRLLQEVYYNIPEAVSYGMNYTQSTCSLIPDQCHILYIRYTGANKPTTIRTAADNGTYENFAYLPQHTGSGLASDYVFPIEKNNKGDANVNTSIELYLALENGYNPVIVNNDLKTMYKKMKTVLKTILDENMNDYEIALAIYDYLSYGIVYDYAGADDATALYGTDAYNDVYGWSCFYMEGVFNYGLAVCNGISAAYSALCNMMGIECHKLTGVASGGAHAWVKLKIGGNWYLSDATWANYRVNIGTSTNPSIYEATNYNYFLMTEDECVNSKHTVTKATYFEMGQACDSQIDVYKNIKFVYNNITYDYSIDTTSVDEYNALLSSLVQEASNGDFVSNDSIAVMIYCEDLDTILSKSKWSTQNYTGYSVSYVNISGYDNVHIIIITKK